MEIDGGCGTIGGISAFVAGYDKVTVSTLLHYVT